MLRRHTAGLNRHGARDAHGPDRRPQTTLGTLPAATYGYRASQYNVFGETLAEATVTATTTGSTGLNVISGLTLAAAASGARIYGRTQGIEQYLGVIPNIGSQATSSASGTGTVTSLAVTALTSSIPQGTTFQIAGDTNTTKIVFTTTAFAPAGTVVLAVSTSQSVTTTIAPGAINPVFVDSGSITPSGNLPTTDQTAGPGSATGYQAPALGSVANPNGVSVECFSYAIVGGRQATVLPYWWWVFPCFANAHIMPRDLTNANAQTIIEGDGFQNPNWGGGPGGATGNFPFDSQQVLPGHSLRPDRCAGCERVTGSRGSLTCHAREHASRGSTGRRCRRSRACNARTPGRSTRRRSRPSR